MTDRQTDRRTDGIAIASTAAAMRALRFAVKNLLWPLKDRNIDTPNASGIMAAMLLLQKEANGYVLRRRLLGRPIY